jgi:hypothetical protein
MIEAWVEEPLAAAEAAAADGHGAAQQLKAAEEAAASRLAKRPLEAAAFLEGVALAARRPEIRDVLERRLNASARRLQQLVERSGVVAGAAEQQQLGHALVTLHDGFAIQAALGRPPEVSVVALLQAATGRGAGTLQVPGPQP